MQLEEINIKSFTTIIYTNFTNLFWGHTGHNVLSPPFE